MFIKRLEKAMQKTGGVWQQTAGSPLVYRIVYLAWRTVKSAFCRTWNLVAPPALSLDRLENGMQKTKGIWQQTAGRHPVYRVAHLAWRAVKSAVCRIWHLAQRVSKKLGHGIAAGFEIHLLSAGRKYVTENFFTLVHPVNLFLAVMLRYVKYKNSVLHISYMVHIPYYTTRILRKQGMKADYLAVGGQSPWWSRFDYHYPPDGTDSPWQEFLFFWRVVARYEVIHAHFGIMLSATGWELPVLKRMGRKIILHYRGCEARDPQKNQELHPEVNICQECDYGGWVCRDGNRRVARVREYADLSLVTTPDMRDFIPGAVHFPFFSPEINYDRYAASPKARARKPEFKIVHVTNHPGIEGTEQIQRVIDRLKEKGYGIDFVFLRGVTPERALREYRDADLSIGKMKMGFYANAQIESMYLGVPAVTHVRQEFVTDEIKNSGFILTDLGNLERTLEYYLDHPSALEEKRKIARSSILRMHDNEQLGRRLIEIYARTGARSKALPEKRTKVESGTSPPHIERPLRVLHIGNIANNAYYNAKFLRRIGIDADVLCYDDYWIMSSPEWEEADFEGVPANQYLPDWWGLGLKGYEHPRWFAQGPFELGVNYLLAKQKGETEETDRLWAELKWTRGTLCSPSWPELAPEGEASSGSRNRDSFPETVHKAKELIPVRYRDYLKTIRQRLRDMTGKNAAEAAAESHFHQEYVERCLELVADFAWLFPERTDMLTMEDLLQYEPRVKKFKELFRHYDVVQGYATDPLYPMLAGFKPYVGFEHGTLRDAPEWDWPYKGPFYDNPIGRITALSYALADHVFITNADCLSSARRLGLCSYEPMPHPLDENDFFPTDEYRAEIRTLVGAEIVFFCPIRHDWVDKGTDIYIRVLPELRSALGNRFRVCFTPWGREIERSKQLIAELGCEDIAQWVGPFCKVRLTRWLSAADVVFDQLAYTSFSGLTPRALACGVPVIAAYDHATTAWMFSEPAPVLAARTVEEVFRQTLTALDPEFRAQYRLQARAWIERHHSSTRVVAQLLDAYRAVVEAGNSQRLKL